ncbi:MAG: hypothetical protein SOS98_03290 [Varibaculum sp.]|nr:hypothetical protein [Varibaculum sp.]
MKAADNNNLENIEPLQAYQSKALRKWRDGLQHSIDTDTDSVFVELSAAHPSGLAQLYSGQETKLSSLIREPRAFAHALLKARDLWAAGERIYRQHGLSELSLAVGTVSWRNRVIADGGYPGIAETTDNTAVGAAQPETVTGPALLIPVRMIPAGSDDFAFSVYGQLRPWPTLAEKIESYGLGDRVGGILGLADTPGGFSPAAVLPALRELVNGRLAAMELYDSLQIGRYQHPLQRIIADLGTLDLNSSDLLDEVVRSSGDAAAGSYRHRELPEPVPTDRDPKVEHGFGDLNAPEHDILDAVASGCDLYLDGGPKSDAPAVLAAMLADNMLAGRTMAVVVGDSRVADAAVSRLTDAGLRDAVADLTDADAPIDAYVGQLARLLNERGGHEPVSHETQIARTQLADLRAKLSGYAHGLHDAHEIWGISAYDAFQVLTDLTSMRPGPRTRVRFAPEQLTNLASDGAERARQVLHRAADAGFFDESRALNPWLGVTIETPEEVTEVLGNVRAVSINLLPEVRADIQRTAKETGLRRAETLNAWGEQLAMLDDIRSALEVFKPQVFERSAADMVIATASKKWREEHALNMKGSVRKRLVKQAQALVRPGRKVDDLHEELVRVQERRNLWRQHSDASGWPVVPSDMDRMIVGFRNLVSALETINAYTEDELGDLLGKPLPELVNIIDSLAKHEPSARQLPKRVEVQRDIKELGLGELVSDMRERRVADDLLDAELDLAWWASALAHILRSNRLLAAYDGAALDEMTNRLVELDSEQVASLAVQVRAEFANRVALLVDENREAAEELERTPVSENLDATTLLEQYPLVGMLTPIIMLHPAQVPQVFPGGRQVDLVVLVDTDSTDVAQLVPAIARARQLVVFADSHRPGGTLGDLKKNLPVVQLPPDREQSNPQIDAFLAEHGYATQVLAVPQARPSCAMQLITVDGRGMPSPDSQAIESTKEEVEAVIDLVMQQARNTPERSLAVLALNERHASRLTQAFVAAAAQAPDTDSYFANAAAEPFRILPVEKAAGLVRDDIILAVGYGKTPHGRLLHEFGNLSREDGESLLVTALCAVRSRLSVVAAFTPEDLDSDRLTSDGPRMLAALMDTARKPQQLSVDADTEDAASSRVMTDLASRVFAMGLNVVPDYGADEGLQIPLAVGHPDYPEEFLVAVLSDDHNSVAEESLRGRLRHRREDLVSRGWRVCTAYSAAVFMDPQGEAEKILNQVLDITAGMPGGVTETAQPEPVEDTQKQDLETAVSEESGEEPSEPNSAGSVDPEVPESGVEHDSETASGTDVESELETEVESPGRMQRPAIAAGLPLAAYSDEQLAQMIAWVRSDGEVRDEDTEAAELFDALGLRKHSPQIDAVLHHVVRQ